MTNQEQDGDIMMNTDDAANGDINGKTTTVSLAHDLMLKMGYKSGLISTNTIKINNKNYQLFRYKN